MEDDKKKGIRIEFLSREILKEKSFEDKMELIIENVRKNNILVMEESLNPREKSRLIKRTMKEIKGDFPGIEFSSFDSESSLIERILDTVLGRKSRSGLLVVGPSPIMEKIKEERDSISLLARLE